mmetsp:Transcript_5701/g.12043  ORF Transcript_5701/g.12043 Transcript_5701/m.12043 type:complete len:161 (-) Transcript_5701:72-554(-)
MPDQVRSVFEQTSEFDPADYEALCKRYLQKYSKKNVQLPGGQFIRRKEYQAPINCNTPGHKALKKEIQKLQKLGKRGEARIYSLLKGLRDWEMKPRNQPFPGSRSDGDVDEIIDLTTNEEEKEIVDVDAFILNVLLVNVVKRDPDAIIPSIIKKEPLSDE